MGAEAWGSIAQLAAEYETITAAAQHDRWAAPTRASGLTDDEADDAIASEAFGALTAELRRAEANHHDIKALLPRLVSARGFTDAHDIAAVLHHRVATATARPAGSGRTRKTPRLIAGLIPEATGTMSTETRQALAERRDLIEARAETQLIGALQDGQTWTVALGPEPKDAKAAATWRRHARTVAAYRDRCSITGPAPLGAPAESAAQKIDAARGAPPSTGHATSREGRGGAAAAPRTRAGAPLAVTQAPFLLSGPRRTLETEAASILALSLPATV